MKQINIVNILVFFIFFSCQNTNGQQENNVKHADSIQTNSTLSKDTIQKTKLISIIGVGDIMLGTNYPKTPNYLPPNNDCLPLLKDVKNILQDADLTFGNCEGVFSDDISHARSCGNSKNCYRFSMPEKFADCFVEAGFDVLSIGNNHVGDLGEYGRKNTVKILKSKGIEFAGLADYPYTVFEKNGITYGFTAFAPNAGTNRFYDVNNAKKIVQMLDTLSDIVIVSMHIGAEGSKYQHITKKTEYFLGQNRGNPYRFAHMVIDAGADIVFGHGPHVTRAVDIYKNRFITYSMGNFATYRRFNLSGANALAPIFKVFVDSNGKFSYAKVFSVYQADGRGPRPDSNNRALTKIIELTKSDLPELKIEITGEGIIKAL
ncbi:MAG: CapA family protein [Bacteroidales bacterium]|nr:CapA family protein [Bacteroidales bacterium]